MASVKKTLLTGMLVLMAMSAVETGAAYAEEAPSINDLTSEEQAEDASKSMASEFRSTIEAKSGPRPLLPSIEGNLKIHSFGVGLGQTFIKGDLSDHGSDRITTDILYNYSASYSFDLAVSYHFSTHSINKTGSFARLHGLAVGIKGKLYQFDSFSPFLLGGLGLYAPKVRRRVNGAVVDSTSTPVFGTHFGVGGELLLNRRFSVGILGHYHNPFDRQEEFGPEIEGSYFKLLITTFYQL